MKYRKKPVEIEAFQLTDDPEMIAPKWFTQAVADEVVWIDRSIVDGHARIYGCTINTREGRMHAKLGDYIIRETDGRLYSCSPCAFRKNYEPVEGGETMACKGKGGKKGRGK